MEQNENCYMVYKNLITQISTSPIDSRKCWFRGIYDNELGENPQIVHLDALSLNNLNKEYALTAAFLLGETGDQKKLAKVISVQDYHFQDDIDFIVDNYLDSFGMVHLLSLDNRQSYKDSSELAMIGKFREFIVGILGNYVGLKSLNELTSFQLALLNHILEQSDSKDVKTLATQIIERYKKLEEQHLANSLEMEAIVLATECLYHPSEIEDIIKELKDGHKIFKKFFMQMLFEMVATNNRVSSWKESVLFILLKHHLFEEYFFARDYNDEFLVKREILRKLAYLNTFRVSENVLAKSVHLFERIDNNHNFFMKYNFHKELNGEILALFEAFCSVDSLTLGKIKHLKLFAERNKTFRKFVKKKDDMQAHFSLIDY